MPNRPSPLQNRVTPGGEIISTPARGTLMGNRGGRLHKDFALQSRRWASRQWISCVLSFNGRQRTVMGDSYTELFFLDEATAIAAGHRPCFECRRQDALYFATRFADVAGQAGRARAPDMDRILHEERTAGPWQTPADALPTGAIYRHLDQFWLVFGRDALMWEAEGYRARLPIPDGTVVEVLTCRTMTRVLAAGFRPGIHPSAMDVLTM